MPTCQPMMDTVVPSPKPEYQPVSAETVRSRPNRKISRPPSPGSASNGSRPRTWRSSALMAGRVWGSLRLSAALEARSAHAYNSRVAKVEPQTAPEEDSPPLDPEAVERAYRLHRARRAARERFDRQKRWAGFRFWLVLTLVLAATVVLAARTLGEIERVFGL